MGGAAGDLDLAPLQAALAPYGVRVAARRIRAGDEAAFAHSEPVSLATLMRARASGAARIAARTLLAELGADSRAPLARSASGAPVWPHGIIGSLAHDPAFALAAVARGGVLDGVGIDVEPAEPLPADLVDFALDERERREAGSDRIKQRLVFAAKEAVYKAIHPLDGSPLEYSDIHVGLGDGVAILRDARRLRLFTLSTGRLVAVALCLRSGVAARTRFRPRRIS
jgi:4'-phosphopantetheinyl transferase EntD